MKHYFSLLSGLCLTGCLNFNLKGDSVMHLEPSLDAGSSSLDIDSFSSQPSSSVDGAVDGGDDLEQPLQDLFVDFDGRTLLVDHMQVEASCDETWSNMWIDFEEHSMERVDQQVPRAYKCNS